MALTLLGTCLVTNALVVAAPNLILAPTLPPTPLQVLLLAPRLTV
jgi:hypothetical protein